MCVREQRSATSSAALIRMVGSHIGLLHGRAQLQAPGPSG